MRKSLLMFSIFILLSCGSTKTNLTKTQDWLNSQNFTIVKPNNWRAVKNHGYVGYTPLKKGDNFFNNVVSIFQFKLKDKPEFKMFVQKQIELAEKSLSITSQEILTEKSEFGDIYIFKTESTWSGRTYKKETIYIEYNGEYYNYNYSSLKDNYEKYYDDAFSIFQSIEFKE